VNRHIFQIWCSVPGCLLQMWHTYHVQFRSCPSVFMNYLTLFSGIHLEPFFVKQLIQTWFRFQLLWQCSFTCTSVVPSGLLSPFRQLMGWGNVEQVNGSLLPAAVIALYCTYLCYSALSSEPRGYQCNGLHKHIGAVSTGTLVLGMGTTLLSVVYSAVRAGSSATFLSPPSSPREGAIFHHKLLLFVRYHILSWYVAM
jgi:hypothetical protein